MGGPKYLYQIHQFGYFGHPNYGHGLLLFKSTIKGWELTFTYMVFGILSTKYKWWVNGRPKISSIGLLLKIFWASYLWTNNGHGVLIFKSTIQWLELPIFEMVFGILLTKYKWWMNGRPKISLLGPLLRIFWAS